MSFQLKLNSSEEEGIKTSVTSAPFADYKRILELIKNDVKAQIINTENGCIMWDGKDDKYLKQYEAYSYDDWEFAYQGPHIYPALHSSVYFDIDGTLGYWYPDGKGYSLEEILDPKTHYFRDIKPHIAMVMLAETLFEKGIDVCIISSADRNCIRDKWEWIDNYLPFLPKENICFAPLGYDKCNFVKGNSEFSILIDDYQKNLEQWPGLSYKAINTINSNQTIYPEIDFTRLEEMYYAGIYKKEDIKKEVNKMTDKIIETLKEIELSQSNNDYMFIYDICEILAKHAETKHLVSWFGDYALYEPALGVSEDEIKAAYKNLLENEKSQTEYELE